jgi:hypothetical protein
MLLSRVLLVQNIEDIDDIIRALRRRRNEFLDRKKFRQLVVDTLGNRAMTPAHIDFLWQVFDRSAAAVCALSWTAAATNSYAVVIDSSDISAGGGGGDETISST